MFSGNIRSTLTHLRLPFSIFLAPVFFFALSESDEIHKGHALAGFLLMHLLLFPASNAYNSYYDKDEGSIGLIKSPPPTTKALLFTALWMDLAAILLSIGLNLGAFFTIYLILYGLMSKAYSHPATRLKKYPLVSLLTVSVFQGFYTFLASYQLITGSQAEVLLDKVLIPALLSSLNLLAIYPLTQIYQHEEDKKHGDLTYSRLVGIRGTFFHAATSFFLSFAGFGYWYVSTDRFERWLMFGAFMTPVLIYFLYWWKRTLQQDSEANYANTMRMSALASVLLNIFFIVLSLG
jgi:1,4-dihydroxy-2-naphthoate octaprenyltransferase